ncbi:Hcp family type VI secretion system effector [Luteolibacter luteus]|uniref:Type VI secretion system tube protein Hcp n=1 Tax=Luteolibacter luteus TaxID=2728835 RepID=A0A858RJI4_9BACT|nr:type VI secretion system tube protein Hcp [Luteolibacter luteus]QJE96741.1 type VI secretion system tube protein Hcp [Luteolibacter luteus]
MKAIPSLSRTLALTVPAVALSLTGAHAASDYLLEIEGIKGESTDDKHRDAIEIESFSWGATNDGIAKAITFSLGKRIDKSSPLLFLACAKGNHIPQAILTCRKSGGDGKPLDYYVITLSDILISSYQSGGGGGAGGATNTLPVDQISFNYHKIKFEYRRMLETGQLEDPVIAEYDFGTSSK